MQIMYNLMLCCKVDHYAQKQVLYYTQVNLLGIHQSQ